MGGELNAEHEGLTASPATPTKEYVYGPTGMLAEVTGGEVNFLTPDHLGSPRVLTSQNGIVVNRRDFFPFGEDIAVGVGGRSAGMGYGTDSLRQRFTGYEKDEETGLDFAQARYYTNALGRFQSTDPFGGSGKTINPQTWNRFTYCLNNPVNFVDPLGLQNQPPGKQTPAYEDPPSVPPIVEDFTTAFDTLTELLWYYFDRPGNREVANPTLNGGLPLNQRLPNVGYSVADLTVTSSKQIGQANLMFLDILDQSGVISASAQYDLGLIDETEYGTTIGLAIIFKFGGSNPLPKPTPNALNALKGLIPHFLLTAIEIEQSARYFENQAITDKGPQEFRDAQRAFNQERARWLRQPTGPPPVSFKRWAEMRGLDTKTGKSIVKSVVRIK
ncbi:MAG: RHS repeat-associated core domain-containing protein [Acidobacteria bacterium]|nr:RHS repeat-associated core domain-containing protein [Acidobacteriota bacterium]